MHGKKAKHNHPGAGVDALRGKRGAEKGIIQPYTSGSLYACLSVCKVSRGWNAFKNETKGCESYKNTDGYSPMNGTHTSGAQGTYLNSRFIRVTNTVTK
jgi:hypothetical protein